MIKGLDAKRYSVEDSVTVYLGIASYIADKRGLQDKKGNVLCTFLHRSFAPSSSLFLS